ncbi:MAG: hypothetical protein WCD43_07625 [Candidatus Acidiferrales bacterium]
MRRSLYFNEKSIPVLATTFAAILATVAYFATTFVDQQGLKDEALRSRVQTMEVQNELRTLEARISGANDKIEQSVAAIAKTAGKVPDSPQSLRQIALLNQDIDTITSSLTTMRSEIDTINSALVTNPEKALTVPLLRKDVDELKAETQRDMDSLRGEMTRGYDLNRWLIGLILAVLIGTVINNAIQSKSPKGERRPRFE